MVFTPILSGSGFAGFQYLTRTREEQTERLAASTQTRQQVEEFTSKLGSIETPADLMDNPMMLRVALGAFGLDEDFGNRAFIQRVLEADLSDSSSLPNRLADKRYLAFAQAFNFSGEDGPQLEGSQFLCKPSRQPGLCTDVRGVWLFAIGPIAGQYLWICQSVQ